MIKSCVAHVTLLFFFFVLQCTEFMISSHQRASFSLLISLISLKCKTVFQIHCGLILICLSTFWSFATTAWKQAGQLKMEINSYSTGLAQAHNRMLNIYSRLHRAGVSVIVGEAVYQIT